MYLGRIVSIGMTSEGKTVAAYRVSSRSFPNREAKLIDESVAIMPRKGFEGDLAKSPYIAYNCIRMAGPYAVVTNGSHTDPIVEKITMGMPVRDALTLSLLAMDYEKDDYNTPRIAAVISNETNQGYLGIVTKDSVIVRAFELTPGAIYYLSTYEKEVPNTHNIDKSFNAETPEEVCQFVIDKGVFADFEHPVTSASVISLDAGFEIATQTV